jgi:prevent-host-death family protein
MAITCGPVELFLKTLSAAEFRNRCLAVLEQVERTRVPVVVTRHGRPVARIAPIQADDGPTNPLRGTVEYEGDLVAPLDERWDADR